MPLSEHEQRILEQIEKSLYEEDPSFGRGTRRQGPRFDRFSRVRLGVTSLLGGVATLALFFARGWVFAGVVAFVLMVTGIVLLAGSLSLLATTQQDRRERLRSLVSRWEESVRNRYKRS